MDERRRTTDLGNAAFCVLLTLAALFLTVPQAEIGFNDDAPYCHMVKVLAETGRFAYNGWATAALIPQIYWAALGVKVFGYSFTLVHLTTLPAAAGCAALMYTIGRQGGLAPGAAVAGTLFVTLSPLFLPNGVALMTDIPGLLFLLLTLRAYAAALDPERSDTGRMMLLGAGTVAGLVGGAVRQSVWIAPLLLLPYVYFATRDRGFRITVVANLAAAVAGIAGTALWLQAQPYTASDSLQEQIRGALSSPSWSLRQPLFYSCRFVLDSLPLLATVPYLSRRLQEWPRPARWLVPALIGAALLAGLALSGNAKVAKVRARYLAPWDQTGNMVTRQGVLNEGLTTIGKRPPVLPEAVWYALSGTVYVILFIGVAGVVRTTRRPGGIPDALRERWAAAPPVTRLLALYLIGYLLACLPRVLNESAYDRYFLPALPLVSLLCLKDGATFSRRRWFAVAAGIGAWAVYGVAATHDYVAMMRAVAVAAARAEASGVRRTSLRASFEYDCWTQIEVAGYVNSSHITRPAGAYRKTTPKPSPFDDGPVFWEDTTPAVSPTRFVVLTPQAKLTDAASPTPYRCWLPPFDRTVRVQKLPEAP